MTKLLVLYVFHELNNRVYHFINNCIFYDENVDFVIISNSQSNIFKIPAYVKVIFRDNIGHDFGGWSDALIQNNLYCHYDHFIFLNSSVIGPFIPSYCKDKWTNIYINGLQNNVKLFGSTINAMCNPLHKSHVQSYIFAMDKNTVEYLIQCEIFTIKDYVQSRDEAIHNKEILMSRKVIENGWNIGSLFEHYKDVDFTFKDKKPEEYNIQFFDDVMFSNYRGHLWNEHQLVFIKGNRIF